MVSREEKDNKAVNERTQDMRQEPLEHLSRSRAHRSQARHRETVASEKEEQKNTEKAPFKNTLGFLCFLPAYVSDGSRFCCHEALSFW